jgi:hypothetical protein
MAQTPIWSLTTALAVAETQCYSDQKKGTTIAAIADTLKRKITMQKRPPIKGYGAIRFTKISLNTIEYQRQLNDDEPETCRTKISSEPDDSYYQAIDSYRSIVADVTNWNIEQISISSVSTAWTYSDRIDDWVQSLTIATTYTPDQVMCPIKITLGKVALESLPEMTVQLQEKLFDETWAYLHGKRTQQVLELFPGNREAS